VRILFVKKGLDKIPNEKLYSTTDEDLGVFLMDNKLLPIKNEGDTYYYIKGNLLKKLLKKYSKRR